VKGKPTLSQKQTNSAYQALSPTDLYEDPSVSALQNQRYDAAGSSLLGQVAEDFVRSVFGTKWVRSAALLLDPTSQYFKNSGKISPWNRIRTLDQRTGQKQMIHSDCGSVFEYQDAVHVRDYAGQPEYTSYSFDTVYTDPYGSTADDQYKSTIRDTSRKTRKLGEDFGTCLKEVFSRADLIPHRSRDLYYLYTSLTVVHDFYPGLELTNPVQKTTYNNYVYADGPLVYPLRPLFPFTGDGSPIPKLKEFMNNKVLPMIQDTAPTSSVFNSFYNIAELKDIPQLLVGIRHLKEILEGAMHLNLDISKADKLVADQYLNYQFGVASVLQAVRGFCKLPEKAAKKLNYLLKRSGKVTSSRSTRTFTFRIGGGNQDIDPSFYYGLWPQHSECVTISNVEVYTDVKVELRLVINQSINFPTVAVPKFSDKNYRKILGIQPTVRDFYNLVPFTWLVDWFTGLGDYVSLIDAIFSDRQLINYGFMTAVVTEVTTHKYQVEVRDAIDTTNWHGLIGVGDPTITTEIGDESRKASYHTEYTREIYFREDLSQLDGVKSFGNGLISLSDFQTSILGALLSKFS